MTDHDSKHLRVAEATARRRVESLRRAVYAQADPSGNATLYAELIAAEEALCQAEREREAAEGDAGQGVLLDSSGGGQTPGGTVMGPETTQLDAKVLLRMSHVPTGIAHLLGRETPLVTFVIKNVGDDIARLRVVSRVEGYSATAVDTVEVPADRTVTIDHLPTFFPDRLSTVTEMTRATLNIRIEILGKGELEQESTFPVWLLARTSAYAGVKDPSTGDWVALPHHFGAWVTPNADAVMSLLRQAASAHPQRRIVGYQEEADGIERQVEAIFKACKATDIVYVNSLVALGEESGVAMQRVRLPRESIANRSANCIDGTVLMASVLEAASLNPAIVIVPGHAFLGWEKQADSGDWDYVETTMIGTHDFAAAVAAGRALASKQQALVASTKKAKYFTRLSVAELRRERGIMPME